MKKAFFANGLNKYELRLDNSQNVLDMTIFLLVLPYEDILIKINILRFLLKNWFLNKQRKTVKCTSNQTNQKLQINRKSSQWNMN